MPSSLSRQYNKLCDLADFGDPAIREKIREITGRRRPPEEELHRKLWEYALLGLYLEETGALGEDVQALAVAAGHEEPLFWMANRVGRMLATDIYGQGGFASQEADRRMLDDPTQFAPYPYREDRLEVRSMNALDLDLPDDSFDVVFSLSSIEHFGGREQAQRAAREMARVLKPGGHLIIVTEVFVNNHPLDWPLVQTAVKVVSGGRRWPTASPRRRIIDGFRPRELERDVIAPTGLRPVQPLDLTLSPETFRNVHNWVGGGETTPKQGTRFPHIMLQTHGSPWTSAFVALRAGA